MPTTEDNNPYSRNIEKWEVPVIVRFIHLSDIEAYNAVSGALDAISEAAEKMVSCIKSGGRAIMVGAGTSGRIALQDVVELEPTYGIDQSMFEYIMAGGNAALVKSIEGAEDDENSAIEALKNKDLGKNDIVIGITASGRTPFVISSLRYAKSVGAVTVGITDNQESPLSQHSDIFIFLNTGAEVIQGSTRMKAGTAQKMTLNIMSTTVAVKLGFTYKNTMSRMGVRYNQKLKERAIRVLREEFGMDRSAAEKVLKENNYDLDLIVRAMTGKK